MRYTVVGRGSRRDVERKGRQGRNLTKSRKEIKVNKLRIEGIRSDRNGIVKERRVEQTVSRKTRS
jgi:hypothetical protein